MIGDRHTYDTDHTSPVKRIRHRGHIGLGEERLPATRWDEPLLPRERAALVSSWGVRWLPAGIDPRRARQALQAILRARASFARGCYQVGSAVESWRRRLGVSVAEPERQELMQRVGLWSPASREYRAAGACSRPSDLVLYQPLIQPIAPASEGVDSILRLLGAWPPGSLHAAPRFHVGMDVPYDRHPGRAQGVICSKHSCSVGVRGPPGDELAA